MNVEKDHLPQHGIEFVSSIQFGRNLWPFNTFFRFGVVRGLVSPQHHKQHILFLFCCTDEFPNNYRSGFNCMNIKN